ncbi:MAG TPA: hypothetical protein VHV31_06800, partial [Nitrolancea sp.]|nr:hypothetical protein [Nitrolancea sp.]
MSTQGISGSQLLIASPIAIGTVPGSTPPPSAIVPDSDNPELITPSVPYQPSQGIPAISPRTDHQAGQPAFTEQDVRAYVTDHLPFEDSSQAPPTITKIEFLSAHDAETELQTSLDGHSDLVCVVWLSGTFNV